jgi:hypothetical protein
MRFRLFRCAEAAFLMLICATHPACHAAPQARPEPREMLRVEGVKFEPVNSHQKKMGFTHLVTVAVGCSRKPRWWGTDAAPKWLVDVGLVYPQGNRYRRLRLKNGTTTPAGSMPAYNSMTGQYITYFSLRKADIQNRIGKVVLTAEFVLSRQVGGVRFETVSNARFQRAKHSSVASVLLWVPVPLVRSRR